MRYNKLIRELEYFKEISGEDNPEVVVNSYDEIFSFEIEEVKPVTGIEDTVSIGLMVQI